MLSDVMDFYGLTCDFRRVGYFETDHHKQIFRELNAAIKQGSLVALTGIVGCGKTTMLKAIRTALTKEKEILVSQSLSVEKERVKLGTLMLCAVF